MHYESHDFLKFKPTSRIQAHHPSHNPANAIGKFENLYLFSQVRIFLYFSATDYLLEFFSYFVKLFAQPHALLWPRYNNFCYPECVKYALLYF